MGWERGEGRGWERVKSGVEKEWGLGWGRVPLYPLCSLERTRRTYVRARLFFCVGEEMVAMLENGCFFFVF
jgi:hypothetical protein